MTGHKKRFCSFELWTKTINITKNMGYVRSVGLENTLLGVSVAKFALRRTRKASKRK